jgi:glyoxylase-like metal-dependent hydrolase (beta-lactamase superfamily II)
MKLYSIETGYFKLDGGAMFGVVPKSIWHRLNPADENNLCTWAMRSLLIEDNDRLILIDNGIGDKQDARFFSHYHLHGEASLKKSLHACGFDVNDITDVILTHLHFDHCGGSIIRRNDKLETAFPNAIYWSNEKHWQTATQPNAREKASFLKENILPIQENGQLRFTDETNGQIGNHINIRMFDGHTEGMMLPMIQYGHKTIVFMADLIPSAAHIPIPYVMAYDMQPLKTLNEKTEFLQEAFDHQYILFFQHDPHIEATVLQKNEKGLRAGECNTLASFL